MSERAEPLRIREPAVAGSFYPREAPALRRELARCFEGARACPKLPRLKALIVPHAGLVYSGPVAATAYKTLRTRAAATTRVVLLGPAHRVAFRGIAFSTAEAFLTPLGQLSVDRTANALIDPRHHAFAYDDAHQHEHSIELQLPFLQWVLDAPVIVPLVVGDASSEEISTILETVAGGDETVIVVSSDLSHYHPAPTAQKLDGRTARCIETLRAVDDDGACGHAPVNGFLLFARRRGLTPLTLDLRNSSDTAGDPSHVVGYGAFAFSEPAA
jgi:hypothetical protein